MTSQPAWGTRTTCSAAISTTTREWWPVQLERPLTAVNHPMVISREPFDSSPPLLAASLTMGLATGRDRLREFAGRYVRRLGVQVLGTMIPSPDQRITLAPIADEDDPGCSIAMNLHFDDSAVGALLRARERYEAVSRRPADRCGSGRSTIFAPASYNHLGGTMRMHRRADFGVLDEWNRVHDVPECRRVRRGLLHDRPGEEPDPHRDGDRGQGRPPTRRATPRQISPNEGRRTYGTVGLTPFIPSSHEAGRTRAA